MPTEEVNIFTKDGLKLFGTFNHVEKPAAVACLIHGFGEHQGRLETVKAWMEEMKIAWLACDLRGHGRSEGLKGHTPSYDLFMSDIEEILKTARADYTDSPMFLFGHSMGGNIVLNFALKENVNELTGIIASSPWLKLAFEPPKWKLKLGEIMARAFPWIRQPNDLNPDHLSKIPSVAAEYREDPLINTKISAGLFNEVTKACEYAMLNAKDLKTPTLIYHGTSDMIIDYRESKKFAELSGATFHALDNVYHEPHNDKEKDEVKTLLTDWLTKELKNN